MSRILLTLGGISLAGLAATLWLGIAVGNLYDQPSEATLVSARVHRLSGTAAALGVVFVECLIVTYFIGTGRWCQEVVVTYGLQRALSDASAQLKRRAFPAALGGMLAVVGVAALGAAADPATGRAGTASWTNIHLLAACAGIGIIAWTYYFAWNQVVANQAVIERIAAEVASVRRQRGLDSEPPAVEAH